MNHLHVSDLHSFVFIPFFFSRQSMCSSPPPPRLPSSIALDFVPCSITHPHFHLPIILLLRSILSFPSLIFLPFTSIIHPFVPSFLLHPLPSLFRFPPPSSSSSPLILSIFLILYLLLPLLPSVSVTSIPMTSPSPPPPLPLRVGSFHGHPVLEWDLLSPSSGVLIRILNFGALIRDWKVPVGGERRSVVLGFDRIADYPEHSPFFGAIVGRVANRIGGARFSVNGKEYKLDANEGQNHLHGGAATFAKRLWKMEPIPPTDQPAEAALRLSLDSPDGDGGYPGNVRTTVTYSLRGNKLRIEMEATTDAPCPINIVQHNYFNLAGDHPQGDIRDHWLIVRASHFTPCGPDRVPTGEIRAVCGTELDYGQERQLCDNEKRQPVELDHNFVLDSERGTEEPVAVLRAPDKSLTLRLWTNQPALQVYTAGGLCPPVPGLHGLQYGPFGAICLEDQNFPDAVNKPKFPNSILRPRETYQHWCEIEIGTS